MKLFGLTGGVGMGKSTAAGILSKRGFALIDTDEIARALVEPETAALEEIKSVFGARFVGPDGKLCRRKLAELAFSDAQARGQLESILHPRIRANWKEKVSEWRAAQLPFAAVVIPLLFETEVETEFDATIAVGCASKTQRERLSARGWNGIEIERRVASQLSSETKMARADFVIWSEGSLATHERQLDRILALAA
jgi:dephospho-CoA kinase